MVRAVVTDIEGTTSSLSFVKEVLFPYARERIPGFLRAHADDPAVKPILEEVRAETGNPDLDLEGVIAQLTAWIDADAKVTPLKALQGLVWEAGYRDGDFHGHIYPDAVEALTRWQGEGVALYVYSSGSVYAQKLLFGHTEFGDLTRLFSGYFDTRIGPKTAAQSYRCILAELGLPGEEVLFLSDVAAELDAAAAAGMRTVQLVRDAASAGGGSHLQVADFGAIDPAAE